MCVLIIKLNKMVFIVIFGVPIKEKWVLRMIAFYYRSKVASQ